MRSFRRKAAGRSRSSGEELGIEWRCYVVIVDHEQEIWSFQRVAQQADDPSRLSP